MSWNSIETLPQPNSKVVWIDTSGNEVAGTFSGGCIWFPEGSSMYIYYTPKMWRYQ